MRVRDKQVSSVHVDTYIYIYVLIVNCELFIVTRHTPLHTRSNVTLFVVLQFD
jgi:hypothetical protein